MAENITPPGVRCDDVSAFCPAVYRLSDGRTAYQGPPLGPEELAAEGISPGPGEAVVAHPAAARDLLGEIRAMRASLMRVDGLPGGELAAAAACYAAGELVFRVIHRGGRAAPGELDIRCIWPWDRDNYAPTNRRRDLLRAAATIVAEVELMDRRAGGGAPGEG